MATTPVIPVCTLTKGNLRAEIKGIDPGARHPIKGIIHSTGEIIDAAWDEEGYCLDNLPDCNLQVDNPELTVVVTAALRTDD